ncbi:MAG: tRNA adenosine(34) deaminase TadA [Cyanobacteria bacterium P01_G01_bin.19]
MDKQILSRYSFIKQTFAKLDYQAYLNHCQWMEQAIALAQTAGNAGDIPVGAIIVDEKNNLVAEASNHKERSRHATAHAEILAIRAANKVKRNYYLKNCTLYVTLEPCPMCAGAILQSRLSCLIYGADEPKTGAIRTVMNIPDSYCSNHRLKVIAGIKEEACRQQLQTWFLNRRKNRSAD